MCIGGAIIDNELSGHDFNHTFSVLVSNGVISAHAVGGRLLVLAEHRQAELVLAHALVVAGVAVLEVGRDRLLPNRVHIYKGVEISLSVLLGPPGRLCARIVLGLGLLPIEPLNEGLLQVSEVHIVLKQIRIVLEQRKN